MQTALHRLITEAFEDQAQQQRCFDACSGLEIVDINGVITLTLQPPKLAREFASFRLFEKLKEYAWLSIAPESQTAWDLSQATRMAGLNFTGCTVLEAVFEDAKTSRSGIMEISGATNTCKALLAMHALVSLVMSHDLVDTSVLWMHTKSSFDVHLLQDVIGTYTNDEQQTRDILGIVDVVHTPLLRDVEHQVRLCLENPPLIVVLDCLTDVDAKQNLKPVLGSLLNLSNTSLVSSGAPLICLLTDSAPGQNAHSAFGSTKHQLPLLDTLAPFCDSVLLVSTGMELFGKLESFVLDEKETELQTYVVECILNRYGSSGHYVAFASDTKSVLLI